MKRKQSTTNSDDIENVDPNQKAKQFKASENDSNKENEPRMPLGEIQSNRPAKIVSSITITRIPKRTPIEAEKVVSKPTPTQNDSLLDIFDDESIETTPVKKNKLSKSTYENALPTKNAYDLHFGSHALFEDDDDNKNDADYVPHADDLYERTESLRKKRKKSTQRIRPLDFKNEESKPTHVHTLTRKEKLQREKEEKELIEMAKEFEEIKNYKLVVESSHRRRKRHD